MSETHTIPPTPETRPSAPVPDDLKPLEAHLDHGNITALDKLHLEFQDKLAAAWKLAFNRVFKEETDKGTRTGEARRLAGLRADTEARRKTYADLEDNIKQTTERFMPTVDNTAPDFDADAYADHYDQVYNAVVHVAAMDPAEWEGDQKADGSLEHNGVLHSLMDYESTPEDPAETSEQKQLREAGEGREQAFEALKEARTKKQEAMATRQRTIFRGRKEANSAFETAEAEYIAKLVDYKKAVVDELRAGGKSAQEINEALEQLTNQLTTKDIEEEHEKLVTGGGKKEQLLRKYAELSTAKKIGVTAVFGVLGVAVGVLTGGAGVLAASGAVAGGVLAASRPARLYGMHLSKLYAKQPDPKQFSLDPSILAGLDHDQIIQLSNKYQEAVAKASIEKGDKIKRRALMWTVGSIATAGAIGMGASHAAEWASNRFEGWSLGMVGGDSSQEAGINPPNQIPSTPEVPAEIPKPFEYSPDAYSINPGEGFYQTFKDMGIPKKDWHELLPQIGQHLHDNFDNGSGHPLAYMMKDGQWGIRMTADGKMPQGALDFIRQAHEQMSATSSISANAGEVPTGGSVDTSLDKQSIANVIKMEHINPQDIAGNPQLEKLSYTINGVSADRLAADLRLPADEWYRNLQPYIVTELKNHNPAYEGYFRATGDYVRFTGAQLPDATMADLLNRVPQSVRAKSLVG